MTSMPKTDQTFQILPLICLTEAALGYKIRERILSAKTTTQNLRDFNELH